MCLYDLQKAFDSVEYPVLLERLYDTGVNGKMWRLLSSWYDGGLCRVRIDSMVSERFLVERGVKQGSIGLQLRNLRYGRKTIAWAQVSSGACARV